MATTRPNTRFAVGARAEHEWAGYSLWLLAAAALGFAVPAIFSSALEIPRNWYLVPYFAIFIPFLYGYARWTSVDMLSVLRHRWVWGVAGGGVLGAIMVVNIIANEPSSARPEGLELVGSILWLGIAYGTVDALLLTVLPVSAAWLAFKSLGMTSTWPQKILAAVAGMLASLVVTAIYHAGYVEFRDADLFSAVFGNGVISLGYLVAANPLTAIIAHIVLHVISVWHGIDTTVTLPPHY